GQPFLSGHHIGKSHGFSFLPFQTARRRESHRSKDGANASCPTVDLTLRSSSPPIHGRRGHMAKVSKETATHRDGAGPVDACHEDVDDGWTIDFVTFNADIDGTPLTKGLPGDKCHSPHWGYVITGRVTYRFEDHDEVCEAGDAYYLRPGHIPI